MAQFTQVKRGYDPEEVDKYIADLEQVIKSYKGKDNAIKNAIISAQIAADNIVKNARAQASEYKGEIVRELEKVSSEIERQRTRLGVFAEMYSGMVRKYLEPIDDTDFAPLLASLDDVDRLLVHLRKSDIMPDNPNLVGAQASPAPATLPNPDAEPKPEPKPESNPESNPEHRPEPEQPHTPEHQG